MSTRLRQQAKDESNVIAFIASHQQLWNHTPGTGLRELARVWHRVHAGTHLESDGSTRDEP